DFDGYTSGASTVTCYGAAIPAGYVATLTAIDCNDAVAAINPGHAEVLYNGVDDNCDGNLDEGFQLLSNVINAQCGITLAAINSVIQVTTFPNITMYRYRVYKIVGGVPTGAPQYVERPQGYFSFTNMASYDYASTYSIQVELQR
ncbi:putative metal-binding motif-containing protein, partial [Flavobacterium silvaticum]